jgi:hypothetical protein
MDFYHKYLKYKSKYIKLVDIKMNGGGKPSYLNLKNINLFLFDSDIEKYLNPVYGFIYNESNAISNFYNYYDPTNKISKLVHNTFNKIPGSFQPTNKLYLNVKPRDLGNFLALRYLCKINLHDKIKKIDDVTNTINNLIKSIRKINTFNSAKRLDSQTRISVCDLFAVIKNKIKNLIKENYEEIKVDGLEFVPPAIKTNDELVNFLENNYLPRLQTYKQKLITDFNEKYKPIYSSDQVQKYINNFIVAQGEFNEGDSDVELYHVVLGIVWWVSNNKTGIKEYYQGLNDVLDPELQIVIPEDFSDNLYKITDLKPIPVNTSTISDFFINLVASSYMKKKGVIKLFDQEYSDSDSGSGCENHKYADCGETSIRNFINILIFDVVTDVFDIHALRKLNPIEKIIEYYTVFFTVELQSSNDKQTIFGKELNSRDAWSLIVSNLENVSYTKNCILPDGSSYKFEINEGLSSTVETELRIVNILQIFKHLFPDVTDFNDFTNESYDLDLELETGLDEHGIGKIKFKNAIGRFTWNFNHGHYHISPEVNNERINNNIYKKSLSKEKQFYLDIFNLGWREILKEYSSLNVNCIYFVDFTPEELIRFFNNGEMDNKIYNIIFSYIYTSWDRDKKRRIYLNLYRVTNIKKYKLTEFGIEYDSSGAYSYDNIISIKNVKGLEILEKLRNLKSIQFDSDFNQELNDSLDELTNLLNLTFGGFNKPFGNSLNKLVNLQNLALGSGFDKPLGNSLDKLTKLEKLSCAGFNQPLDNSLDKLVNLQDLELGYQFDKSLGNSLDSLTNLRNLNIGNSPNNPLGKFNKPLDNSLNSLINLQSLQIGSGFNQPLNNSLENLVNLQDLKLGQNFNQQLNNSLNSLINLQNLTFGDYFNQRLNNSLNSLINLQNLTFGKFFDQRLNNSLDNLENLQSLTFGHYYGESFGHSLDKLINLRSLTCGSIVNYSPLNNSLDNLINLENLTLPNFNRPLNNSLNNLVNLRKLTFRDEFNYPLGNSLDNLVKLQILNLGHRFNCPLGNSLDNLLELENLSFGWGFNQELGDYLMKFTNLKYITISNRYWESLEENIKKTMKAHFKTITYI